LRWSAAPPDTANCIPIQYDCKCNRLRNLRFVRKKKISASRQSVFGPALFLEDPVFLGGKVYDVPNPFWKFPSNPDL